MNDTLALLAADADVAGCSPFTEPSFVQAVAKAGGRVGYASRTDALHATFAGLVPDELLARTSKATGNLVFWSAHSRAFAEKWDGTGVDTELVDVESLRREWSSPEPDPHTLSLLQATWHRSGTPQDPISR